MADPHDDDDELADEEPQAAGAMPDVELDVDALAGALQTAQPRALLERPYDDADLLGVDEDDGLDAEDLESEFEEIDDLLEAPEDPTHPRRLYLVVDGRPHAVTTERFVIGRVSSQCDLAIIDANISRQHCAIERRDGLFFVVDLGSTNGIVIDGVRVDQHPIAEGDVLMLSGHRVVCSFEPPEPEPVVVPEPIATPSPVRPAVTARLSSLPQTAAEPAPMVARSPTPGSTPTSTAAATPTPTSFEERVEQRLAEMSAQLAALTFAVQRLVEQGESLKGVEALAQVIQRRFEQNKRG